MLLAVLHRKCNIWNEQNYPSVFCAARWVIDLLPMLLAEGCINSCWNGWHGDLHCSRRGWWHLQGLRGHHFCLSFTRQIWRLQQSVHSDASCIFCTLGELTLKEASLLLDHQLSCHPTMNSFVHKSKEHCKTQFCLAMGVVHNRGFVENMLACLFGCKVLHQRCWPHLPTAPHSILHFLFQI